MELVREKIALDQIVGRETTQIILEGDIIVPDTKPDMAFVLQTEEKIVVDRLDTGADRVNFIGRFDIDVLYLAKASEQPVYTMSHTAPIDDFIHMEGVAKEHWITAKTEILSFEHKMVNDRKLHYRAIANITVTAERSDMHEMVVHIHDVSENQLSKRQIQVNRTVDNRLDRFPVKDQVTLPGNKPNIREVLQSGAVITTRDVRVQAGRVTLSGQIQCTTLYRGDNDDNLIEFLEYDFPFNGHIDVTGAAENMFADVSLSIAELTAVAGSDDDGEDRRLDVDVNVGVHLKVYSTENIQILEDAYCINKMLAFSKVRIKYPQLVCRNRNQATVKEIVRLDDNAPELLQIFRVRGVPQIDDLRAGDGKITVEGIVHTDIVYLTGSDAAPLACYKTVLPFHQVIETKGATSGMTVTVDAAVEHATFNFLGGHETEVRFQLSFAAQVVEEHELNVINHIDFVDMDPDELDKMASMTVYVVQPGDTLWTIAKRYNTPIDELLLVNELENQALTPGQKLLILKKV